MPLSAAPGRRSRRWLPVALVVGGWLAISVISSSLTYTLWTGEGLGISYPRAIALQLPYWMFWAVTMPLVVWLSRRWPVNAAHWARALPVHLLAASALAVLHSILYAVWYKAHFPWPASEPGGPPLGVFVGQLLRSRWQNELIAYGAILGGTLALRYAREAEARAVAAVQLESQLARTQLTALRMQLHPHFLFNTLQAVSVLVTEDPRRAQRMLALLGDLLRTVLDDRTRQEVPLEEELQFLERYLEIEQTRFPDRLRVTMDVAPETRACLVPGFVLQPLVENAIRYAIAPRATPGLVTVRAHQDDGRLVLEVRDDGPGLPAAVAEGVGLATTRARLEKLYGDAHHFSLSSAPGGGTLARLALPARSAADG